MNATVAAARRKAPLDTPTGLRSDATRDISAALNALVADFFALYLKTKNFHWHVSGPHFRDYHLLLDEQGDQLFATTDVIAERVRKIGGTTLRSVGHIARLQRVSDNDADYVTPLDMLAELREDNLRLAARLRETHEQRWDGLVRDFRSLGIEPVSVPSHDYSDMLSSFLRWADLRQMWRGAIA